MRTKIVVLTYLLFSSLLQFSQTDSIAYSRDYEFKEGIYLTIDQFKANSPLPKEAIISAIPKSELDFLHQVTELKKIKYIDSKGLEQTIETSSIWGYCQNRSLYINLNDNFNKLNVIGRICHFTASVKTSIGYRDPMSYSYGINNTTEELRQYVLDATTNKVYEFDVRNMELLLKQDNELYNQFLSLKKRDKANSIFVYLRKYNVKHPLYLPFQNNSQG